MGYPGCLPIAKIAARLIFTPLFAADGTKNFIDLTATLDADYFTDRMQEYDSSDALVSPYSRWYITPTLENVEDTRAETVFQTFNSGKKSKVRQGVRTFMGFIVDGAAFEMLDKVKEFSCARIGAYVVDTAGNLHGNGQDADKLYPIAIDKQSFDPQLVKATDAEVQMIQIMFDWGRLEDDRYLKMITADSLTAVDLLEYDGLIDLYGETVGAIGQTSFTIDIHTSYGNAISPTPVTGLVAADFALYNVTDSSAVTISSLTESLTVEGRYTVSYASQTSADVLRLTPNKFGFDGDAIKQMTITIA